MWQLLAGVAQAGIGFAQQAEQNKAKNSMLDQINKASENLKQQQYRSESILNQSMNGGLLNQLNAAAGSSTQIANKSNVTANILGQANAQLAQNKVQLINQYAQMFSQLDSQKAQIMGQPGISGGMILGQLAGGIVQGIGQEEQIMEAKRLGAKEDLNMYNMVAKMQGKDVNDLFGNSMINDLTKQGEEFDMLAPFRKYLKWW